MYRRVAMTFTGLILLGVGFGPTGSGATGLAPPRGDLALAPPPEPTPLADQIAAMLRRPGLTPNGRDELLRGFGHAAGERTSPAAFREVIRWLDYDSRMAHEFHEKGLHPELSDGRLSDMRTDYPAITALATVGPPAASALVDEYLACFEETNPDGTGGASGRKGRQLRLVVITLSHNRELAQKAVEVALRRMAEEPNNDHVQQACTDLIKGVIGMFDRHPPLFPPAALRMFLPAPSTK